jgi:hypothetical protein
MKKMLLYGAVLVGFSGLINASQRSGFGNDDNWSTVAECAPVVPYVPENAKKVWSAEEDACYQRALRAQKAAQVEQAARAESIAEMLALKTAQGLGTQDDDAWSTDAQCNLVAR